MCNGIKVMKVIVMLMILSATFLGAIAANNYTLYDNGVNMNFTKYIVEYNFTYGQDNYVVYISTSGGNNYSGCPSWRRSANYTSKDYTNTGFDRGHLVPNADYGNITCTLYNVAPMYPNFNRGIWKRYEDYVRKYYVGKVIIKGCRYVPDMFIRTHTGKILYIPIGCYFVVTNLNNFVDSNMFDIVDYGYIVNSYVPDNVLYRELPWWILAP